MFDFPRKIFHVEIPSFCWVEGEAAEMIDATGVRSFEDDELIPSATLGAEHPVTPAVRQRTPPPPSCCPCSYDRSCSPLQQG